MRVVTAIVTGIVTAGGARARYRARTSHRAAGAAATQADHTRVGAAASTSAALSTYGCTRRAATGAAAHNGGLIIPGLIIPLQVCGGAPLGPLGQPRAGPAAGPAAGPTAAAHAAHLLLINAGLVAILIAVRRPSQRAYGRRRGGVRRKDASLREGCGEVKDAPIAIHRAGPYELAAAHMRRRYPVGGRRQPRQLKRRHATRKHEWTEGTQRLRRCRALPRPERYLIRTKGSSRGGRRCPTGATTATTVAFAASAPVLAWRVVSGVQVRSRRQSAVRERGGRRRVRVRHEHPMRHAE